MRRMDQEVVEQPGRLRGILRSGQAKIQRVAHHLRNREAFAEYYWPRMVSPGLIHHGEPRLELGEKYKLMWTSMYVERDHERTQYLHQSIVNNINELKNLYNEEVIGQFDDQLAWMLFVDGCALLQILKHPDISQPQPLNAKVDQMVLVLQDAFSLENQLPFQLLQLLTDDDLPHKQLIEAMDTFLLFTHFSPKPKPHPLTPLRQFVIDVDPSPLLYPFHLPDELRTNVLRNFSPREPKPTQADNKQEFARAESSRDSGEKKQVRLPRRYHLLV